MVRRQVCHQLLHNGGLRMPDLERHWLAERLAFLGQSSLRDMVWTQKVKEAFCHLGGCPKAKSCHRPRRKAPFLAECCMALRCLPGSSDLSRPQKEVYQDLVVGFDLDPLEE